MRQLDKIWNQHGDSEDTMPLWVIQDADQTDGDQGVACATFQTRPSGQNEASTVLLWNSSADRYGPILEFANTDWAESAGSDGDILGTIKFIGMDDGGPDEVCFAAITASLADMTNTTKQGQLITRTMCDNSSQEVARTNPMSWIANDYMGGFGAKKPVYNWTGTGTEGVFASGSMSGLTILVEGAGIKTLTLPADTAANIGFTIKVILGEDQAAGKKLTIKSDTAAAKWYGGVIVVGIDDDNSDAFQTTGGETQIDLDADETGWLAGSWVELTLIAATKWAVTGVLFGTGATLATPFD